MPRKTEQHRYWSQEKWDRVNEKNKKLFNDFLRYCRSTDKSPDTIDSYESNLGIFFIWMLENADNKSFFDIKKYDIMNFQDWMVNTQNLSSNRVRQLKSTISSMSNFICDMLDEEYPNFKNIVNKIKPPAKQEVREKTVLTNEQIENLLNILVENKKYCQACLVACLAASGVRKGEIIQFKTDFLTDERYDEDTDFI
jgi:integrase/recombinase XerD